jgi:hypothetical protein
LHIIHVSSINITIQEQLMGVNDMTKMIGKVDTKKISNMEWGTNEMDVFLSEDKLILIEMSISVEKFPPVSVQKFPLCLGYLHCF